MTHELQIDEAQRQLILLALAQLSLERPGWHYALGEVAAQLPDGVAMFEEFRSINGDTLPVSRVAETCAKIVETYLPMNPECGAIVEEIRRYAADLDRPENMGANREPEKPHDA